MQLPQVYHRAREPDALVTHPFPLLLEPLRQAGSRLSTLSDSQGERFSQGGNFQRFSFSLIIAKDRIVS